MLFEHCLSPRGSSPRSYSLSSPPLSLRSYGASVEYVRVISSHDCDSDDEQENGTIGLTGGLAKAVTGAMVDQGGHVENSREGEMEAAGFEFLDNARMRTCSDSLGFQRVFQFTKHGFDSPAATIDRLSAFDGPGGREIGDEIDGFPFAMATRASCATADAQMTYIDRGILAGNLHFGISTAPALQLTYLFPRPGAAGNSQSIVTSGSVDERQHLASLISPICNQDIIRAQMREHGLGSFALTARARENDPSDRHARERIGEDDQQHLWLAHRAALRPDMMYSQQFPQQFAIGNADPRPIDGNDAMPADPWQESIDGRLGQAKHLGAEGLEHRLSNLCARATKRTCSRNLGPAQGRTVRGEHGHHHAFISGPAPQRGENQDAHDRHSRRQDAATAIEKIGLSSLGRLKDEGQESSAVGSPHADGRRNFLSFLSIPCYITTNTRVSLTDSLAQWHCSSLPPAAIHATVSDTFFAPILEVAQENPHARRCPSISDEMWVQLGVLRVLEQEPSGRGFVQAMYDSGHASIAISSMFGNLASARRLLACRWTAQVLQQHVDSKRLKHDPLAQYSCLDNFAIFAGDGHYHEKAIHDLAQYGHDTATQHFYALDMRTHALRHITAAMTGPEMNEEKQINIRKREHDMHAIKRIGPESMRLNTPCGRKVLHVWDRACIDLPLWAKFKARHGIYFISLLKDLMILNKQNDFDFDA